MIEDINRDTYTPSKLVFIDRIEKNLEFYLKGKIEKIHKAGKEILIVVSFKKLGDVLNELRNNPELGLKCLNHIAFFERGSKNYLLISLTSFMENFSTIIKVELPYNISKDELKNTFNLMGNYYKPSRFYKDRKELITQYSEIKVFSQPIDGLDCFDLHILSSDDVIEKVYIDTGISDSITGNYYKDKKISEIIPHISRFDYKAGIFPELCFCLGIENLLQMKIPKRAQYIRMMLSELFRISNHIYFISSISRILGCDVIFNLSLIERERVLRIIEYITGSRIIPNFIRIGGVKKDIDKEVLNDVEIITKSLYKKIRKIEGMLLGDIVVTERLKNMGIMNKNAAIDYGLTGPNLRALGIRYDNRKNYDNFFYEDISFTVPLGRYGDCFDRILVRFKEIYQSIKIVNQIIDKMPLGVVQKAINLSHLDFPFSSIVSSMECPHGIFRIYIEVEMAKVLNLVVMGPSKNSLIMGEEILSDNKIDDINLVLASLDISCGEIIS